eukprot:CAMPEP_0204579190 /NCGR_PEP_ID=MMETSP0661-20131031/43347_1 /ASSEMBLY_ACC=CAM_ASM_000606 /TAXON_ID=109239 /ORGANISM="Alexandrium margalefi, Strain AMGDE01CS-322" /LENGTH=410 /DNA_ID=CAMNT_0051588179 /DNA_START=56 /DNA_END=1288 /DNA_ORIENTATION=+
MRWPLAFALCARMFGAPLGGAEQFHVAVTGTPGEIVVTWVTKDEAISTCKVEGVGSFEGAPRTYTDGGWQGVIHAVTLTGLKPSTTYRYACGGQGRELRTPPAAAALPVRALAIADLGRACDKPGCGNATISALSGSVAGSADLLLHAGDIAYTSGDQDIWDEYMREMDPSASRLPYMVCPGNHEHYYNFSGYRHRFDMPGPHAGDLQKYERNLWGSYDIGGVHFVAFSTEHLKLPGEIKQQVAFAREDLTRAAANRGQVPWIVAYGHKPLYCSTEDYYDCKIGSLHIRGLFEPLFREFGVDIYLTGHLHNYERSWPVFNGTVGQQSYVNPRDTVHVVIGSAGDDEGLTDKWEACPAWSVKRDGRHVGFAEMNFANATHLEFNYKDAATGSLIDHFVLVKDRQRLDNVVV